MSKKLIVLVGALVIAVVSLGGLAMAQEVNQLGFRNMASRVEAPFRNGGNCDREEMIDIMRENGFEDMAKAMEERDFESMNKFMENLTEEEYQQMIDLMRENGYDNMARMMESRGLEGMRRMHNSMMGGRRNSGLRKNMRGCLNN